jgi:hypothetical protein
MIEPAPDFLVFRENPGFNNGETKKEGRDTYSFY